MNSAKDPPKKMHQLKNAQNTLPKRRLRKNKKPGCRKSGEKINRKRKIWKIRNVCTI